jgi:hypothetical protein
MGQRQTSMGMCYQRCKKKQWIRWMPSFDSNHSRFMSHPELLKKVPKPGVQGSPCRGLGCPQIPFSSLFAPRLRRREGKRSFWGHPKPRQRAAALCPPAGKSGVRSKTGSSKIRYCWRTPFNQLVQWELKRRNATYASSPSFFQQKKHRDGSS